MKRLLALALIAAGAASCSQSSSASTANIKGAHDLVQVDKLLFTTSTDRDELRVLDLFPPDLLVGARRYLRAPNPLEALSIPVLSRPSALARDSRFEDTKDAMGMVTIARGTEVGGPWVYAMRAGGSEISIVGGGPESDPTQLSEVRKIQAAAVVTAAAGLGRATATSSRLFFATWDGEASTVQSVDLPATVKGLKAAATLPQKVLGTIDGEVVVDLIVVPPVAMRGLCETNDCLVFATRYDQGRKGRVLLFDPETRASRELRFPGPVRSLAIHAGTTNAGAYVPPGQRVFGILDEENANCTGFDDCGGVIAVDTTTGDVALDVTGLPMLPIRTGIALPTGLTVVARGHLLLPPHLVSVAVTTPTSVELSALGIITTSNGALVFFDATGLIPFDTNNLSTAASPLNVGLYNPDGILTPIGSYVSDGSKGGPVFDANGNGITFANGAWKSETIDVVVNGFIPGLEDANVSDTTTQVSFSAQPDVIARARIGDTLVFRLKDNSICTTPITGISGTSVTSNILSTSANGGLCPNRLRWAVRAAGEDKYVVKGSLTGYLGRTGPGKTFSYKGPYFQRVIPFDPNVQTFTMKLGPDNPDLTADFRWTIDVQPNLDNFALTISPNAVGCSTNVAGTVVYDFDRAHVFFALPSANAILDLAPETAHPGSQVEDVTATCYP